LPEPLVKRLAAALATPRPWQRIADPERARGYFEAHTRLATAHDTSNDPVSRRCRRRRIATLLAPGAGCGWRDENRGRAPRNP
jgi:hypothetical protein